MIHLVMCELKSSLMFFQVIGLVMKTCQLFVLDKGAWIPNFSSKSVLRLEFIAKILPTDESLLHNCIILYLLTM